VSEELKNKIDELAAVTEYRPVPDTQNSDLINDEVQTDDLDSN
jgi:hypothetical protein